MRTIVCMRTEKRWNDEKLRFIKGMNEFHKPERREANDEKKTWRRKGEKNWSK